MFKFSVSKCICFSNYSFGNWDTEFGETKITPDYCYPRVKLMFPTDLSKKKKYFVYIGCYIYLIVMFVIFLLIKTCVKYGMKLIFSRHSTVGWEAL